MPTLYNLMIILATPLPSADNNSADYEFRVAHVKEFEAPPTDQAILEIFTEPPINNLMQAMTVATAKISEGVAQGMQIIRLEKPFPKMPARPLDTMRDLIRTALLLSADCGMAGVDLILNNLMEEIGNRGLIVSAAQPPDRLMPLDQITQIIATEFRAAGVNSFGLNTPLDVLLDPEAQANLLPKLIERFPQLTPEIFWQADNIENLSRAIQLENLNQATQLQMRNGV